MGFTLTRLGSSTVSALPTPAQEAKAKANHDRILAFEANPPIMIGASRKQINFAKLIASKFLFHAHAWGFAAYEIELLFQSRDYGKRAEFWINARNPSGNSGEGVTRQAVTTAIANIKNELKRQAKRL
jgi:hypothetical protein